MSALVESYHQRIYSSHCGAYTHVFSCMYFHVSSSHGLWPVLGLLSPVRSPAHRCRPSKALCLRLHDRLANCKALSHCWCNFRAISQPSIFGSFRAVSHWLNLVCNCNFCCHVFVYRVRGGVSASWGRNHVCLIKLSLCEIGLLLSFLLPGIQ